MTTNISDHAAQARTLADATRTHTHYTQSELDRIRDAVAAGRRHEDIAHDQHRTLFAIRSVVSHLTERLDRAPAYRRPLADLNRFAGTTLADMGF